MTETEGMNLRDLQLALHEDNQARLCSLEVSQSSQNAKLEVIIAHLNRWDKIEERLDDLERTRDRQTGVRWTIGAILTGVGMVLGWLIKWGEIVKRYKLVILMVIVAGIGCSKPKPTMPTPPTIGVKHEVVGRTIPRPNGGGTPRD